MCSFLCSDLVTMDYGSEEEQKYNDPTYNQERLGSVSDFSDGSYSAVEGLPSSNPQSPQPPTLTDTGSGKKRRFQVTRACLACATAHVKAGLDCINFLVNIPPEFPSYLSP